MTFHRIDIGAIALSMVCVAHCVGVPLLLTVGPLASARLLSDAQFHWLMLLVALPLSVFGLWQGFTRHGLYPVLALGAVGLSLMALDLVPAGAAMHEHNLTLPGLALVCVAHAFNIRGIRRHALQD